VAANCRRDWKTTGRQAGQVAQAKEIMRKEAAINDTEGPQ
jgi:hypothetical protein